MRWGMEGMGWGWGEELVGGRSGIGVVDIGEERLRSRVHRGRRHRGGPAPPQGCEARDCTVRRHEIREILS
jgi:hypothetical protein